MFMKSGWLLSVLVFCTFATYAQPTVGTWRNTGPIHFPVNVSGQVNGMGRTSQIKFHPSNPAKMYAVSASGGLYISTDTGLSWAPTPGTEIFPATSCSSVCIDYTNDNILYLSTGDQNYYGDSYGIYKSTNGGVSWNAANTGIGNRMAVDIIMDPTDHNKLVAATTDGIWRTTNAGTSWTETYSGGTIKSLKQRPGSNQVLYAATDSLFLRSTDMGASWAVITSGVSVPSGNEGIRIAVTPADTSLVYLGTTGGYGQILKSTDGGSSFSTIYSSTTQCIVCYDSGITSGSQGYYNFNLTVSPVDPNELLLASHCVWRSTDGGYTWSWRTRWWHEVHTDMHDIEFNPYNPSMRFNANDGGVWLSRDTLATLWETRSEGLAAMEMYHAAQSPIDRQLISVGTQDNGELYFDGNWKCNRGGDWAARCGFDYLGHGTIYYDNGYRRDLSPLGSDQPYNAPYTTTPEFNIEFRKTMPNTAFIATDTIWRSSDIQLTTPSWTFLYTTNHVFKSMCWSRADSNILFAVTDDGHVLRSDNALASSPTFVMLAAPAAANVKASISTNKGNANVVYLSCGTTIYRSANKGLTWSNITGSLPSLNIYKVIADEYSSNERLFIGMGNYVYYKDNTTPWTLTAGLPTVCNSTDLMVYNDSTAASILRVSTFGRGVWECNIQNNLPPSGDFRATSTVICPGESTKFYKHLYGNVTSFYWNFPGGSPATSTADSPVVVYAIPGTYMVTLTAIGAYGNDTIRYPAYIVVSNGSAATVTEGFEGTAFPPAQWTLNSESGINWLHFDSTGGFGASGHCMWFDNFHNDAGGRHDRMVMPRADLTYATSATLKFDVAYAYYPAYHDSLLVDISTDCGHTFSTIYAKDTTWLATAPDTTDPFRPTSTQWRTDSISLNAYIGGDVQLAFDNVGHYGQNIYIDNVNLRINIPPNLEIADNGAVQQFKLFPNPVHGNLKLQGVAVSGERVTVSVYDVMGVCVHTSVLVVNGGQVNESIDVSNLPAGLFQVKVTCSTGERWAEKLIIY